MARLRLRQPLYPILIAFLFGLQLMEPSRAWTILLVTFTGIFISAALWAWMLGRNLHLRRETRLGYIQVGGQIEERLTLSNTFLFPASHLEFKDHSTLPHFDANRITSLSAGGFEIWNASAICRQRGFFTLGDAELLTRDPFGIFEVNIHASQRTSILVLPQIASLPELLVAPSGPHGEGQPRRNAPQQTMHASTVREYFHGDSTRLIHWPTTARMDKVFVRLLESAPEGNWWILLDLDAKTMLGEGWDSVEEQSVALAASLADHGLRARKSVGLISNGKELAWLPPQKGEAQRWGILEALATAQPGPLSLGTLLEKMNSLLGKHHSLIVITASLKVDWLKTLVPLTKRGILPTVLLLDPESFGAYESAKETVHLLESRGIKCHLIPRGMIQPPQRPARQVGQWSWRTTASGEVVPVRN
jgi:uncharacterized protein (DUF58 family)